MPDAPQDEFPKLCAAARLLPRDPDSDLSDEDIVRIACSDCPFYKEGEDEELECGAFRLLRHLLRRRVLTVGQILEAVRPGSGAAGSETAGNASASEAGGFAASSAGPTSEDAVTGMAQGTAGDKVVKPGMQGSDARSTETSTRSGTVDAQGRAAGAEPVAGGGARSFLRLAPHVFPKRLEKPALYDVRADELYELDEEAWRFLAGGPSRKAAAPGSETAKFLEFCLAEGLLVESNRPAPVSIPDAPPLEPSLRYLMLHLTDRCTLRCRHCCVGRPTGTDLPIEDAFRAVDEFAALQGLRLIVTGGEPMLHRHFWRLNERLPQLPLRSVLLTNGTMLDPEGARALKFHEVQVSVDGPEEAHDALRGKGSYRRAIGALGMLVEASVAVSVATVVTALNLDRFDELGTILKNFPLRGWSIDVPCPAGFLAENAGLAPDLERAAPLLARSFGGGFYGSSGNWACGPHLAAVMPDGRIDKCGYFADNPAGHLRDGLAAAWPRVPRWRLEELSCRCQHLEECRGGCRFRAQAAGDVLGPDPVQCAARGVAINET